MQQINDTLDNPNTHLCIALSNYEVEEVKTILNTDFDFAPYNNEPLMTVANDNTLAFPVQYKECLDLMITAGMEIDDLQESILRATANQNHVFLSTILDSGLIDSLRNDSAIIEAARNNDVESLKLFEKHGLIDDPKILSDAFCCAVEESNIEVIDYLVEKVDRSDLKHDPLERAAYFSETAAVNYLINEHNFSINSYDNSFLMTAVIFCDSDFCNNLLTKIENPYSVLTDETLMNNIIQKDPTLIETLQERMTSYNIETSQNRAEQQNLNRELEIKPDLDNNHKMNM